MEASVYEAEARLEKDHWWFVGRRRLFEGIISRLGLSRLEPVIDLGSGTGANLRLLSRLGFSDIRAVDLSADSIAFCRSKNLPVPILADVAATPFPDDSFALVLATDVIEHLDDDQAALREIFRILTHGGAAIVTVPAFRSLWGAQDDLSHHKRRYRMKGLIAKLRDAGFVVREAYYFNFLLFIPILLARQIIRLTGTQLGSENELNTPLLNRILTAVFALDVAAAPYLHVPFGVSILARLEKP